MDNIILELKRDLGQMVKYKFNLIFANSSLLIVFFSLTEYLFVENREVVFFMLFCWYFATHGLSIPLLVLEDEMYDRTIVTIIQSRTSITRVLVDRSIVKIIIDFIKAVPVFLLLYIIGDYDFTGLGLLDFLSIVLAIALTIIASYGIGFVFSGLTLKYKRAGGFLGVFDYFILFFSGITLEVKTGGLLGLINFILPFARLRVFISRVFLEGISLGYFLPLVISTLVWIVIGVVSLQKALDYSIEKGLIYGV